jgi:hypothetical protein
VVRSPRDGGAASPLRAPRLCLLDDGETFVAVVQVDGGVENPIPGLLAFRELQEVVESSRATSTKVQSSTVVGSYRLF